jgi:OOP family OmpA-OmpF porin
MSRSPLIPPVTGLVAVALLALVAAQTSAGPITARLSSEAKVAIAKAGGSGVEAHFTTKSGMASRHPTLTGGQNLDEAARDRTAKAIGAVPGVGGIRWEDGSVLAHGDAVIQRPLNCEDDVAALLRSRTIRFEEGSARIDAASRGLVTEVSDALRPCLGSIIAVIGHTDASGPEPGNLALSRERAEAVRKALVDRGIPADGLRARGVGSHEPVEGLDPADPANRRIEFSVIETVPIKPTPVDTPGPR